MLKPKEAKIHGHWVPPCPVIQLYSFSYVPYYLDEGNVENAPSIPGTHEGWNHVSPAVVQAREKAETSDAVTPRSILKKKVTETAEAVPANTEVVAPGPEAAEVAEGKPSAAEAAEESGARMPAEAEVAEGQPSAAEAAEPPVQPKAKAPPKAPRRVKPKAKPKAGANADGDSADPEAAPADAPVSGPHKKTQEELMREANTIAHCFTHKPKNPYCIHCARGKVQRATIHKGTM